MIYVENDGKISKLTTDAPFTPTHTPVRLFDLDYGYSHDALEALLNSGVYYEILIPSLPGYGEVIVKAAIVWDEKAANVDGGTFTAGAWRQRDLNTELDPDNLVSVASNAVTILVAGNYLIRAVCPAFYVTRHRARITKNNSQVAIGQSVITYEGNTSGIAICSFVGILAINDVIRIEHNCITTRATNGFGVSGGIANEIYAVMELIKLD